MSSEASEDDRYDSHATTSRMNAQQKNAYGERLYALIQPAMDDVSISTIKEVGMWTEPGITAGKMTGMALERYSAAELEALIADPQRLAEHMVDCVWTLWVHTGGYEKHLAAQAAERKVERKAQKKHERWVQKQERKRLI